MKKLFCVCGGALIALLAAAGLAPAAHAYPDANINLTVNRQVLYGGETFTATGTSDVSCDWHLSWNDVVRTGQGSEGSPYRTTYTAPAVTKVTKIPLHGTCTYTQPTARQAAARAPRSSAVSATWERTIMITVLPQASAVLPPTASDLPNTGGPNFLFFLAGVGLLMVGASAVVMARRRAESIDTVVWRT